MPTRSYLRVLASLAASAMLVCGTALGQTFDPGCPLPFADIQERHAIDEQCGIEGQGSAASELQNRAKNNFCATGDPATVTLFTLRKVQQIVEQAHPQLWDIFHLPADRAIFRDLHTTSDDKLIGEGSLVRFVAFIIEAHPSGKENVNCNRPGGKEFYDAHVTVGKKKTDDPCDGIVVETSPHFRPETWDANVLNHIPRPVRFTGQLFFDAGHKPCPEVPPRFSLWEIHPIYAIDVCKNKSLSGCPVDDEEKWKPLHEWLGAGGGEPH